MKTEKFFQLNPCCHVVSGAKRGAIYNTESGRTYSIDGSSLRILRFLHEGLSFEQVVKKVALPPEIISGFMYQLKAIGLGDFFSRKKFMTRKILEPVRPPLSFLWLELTKSCNLHCLHCYASAGGCCDATDLMTVNDWERVLREARSIGCASVSITGGEPTLKPFLKRVIKLAFDLGYRINLDTNATLIDKSLEKVIIDCGVMVHVSIYSNNPKVHDQITQVRGSFEKTMSSIRALKKVGVPVSFEVVVMKENQKGLGATLDFIRSLGEIRPTRCFDFLRPVGRGRKGNPVSCGFLEDLQYLQRPTFLPVYEKEFVKRISGNDCWQGKLCVLPSGNVVPCVLAREDVCGNVLKTSLGEIVNGNELKKFWSLSKDKISVCQDCEYRYACPDCRPKAKAGGGENLYAKPYQCFYDPYSGIWGKGR